MTLEGVKMQRHNPTIALVLLLLFEIGSATATPFEITVSQRYSDRSYTNQPVTSQQLLTLLSAAYGYSGANRVLPKIGDAYSLALFPINSSGSYIYTPEKNSMSVWNTSVSMETISPRLVQSWENGANVVVVIVWNQTKMNNGYFAYSEAGYLVQNFYLAAVNSAIGTCCAQTFDSDGLRTDLGLPSTMVPLLIMPTGFPTSPYPAATPDYSRTTGNLPPVQNSEKSFTDALSDMNLAQTWSTQALSLQEQSQLLWAAYGYSSTGHRTTPSYGGWYPLIVYMSNATGTFRYWPGSHSLTELQAGDKRSVIAAACGNQVWAANAPAIFLVAYNSSYNTYYPEPGWYDFSVEVDAGCVAQQILLESSAMSLGANVVAKGFEAWNGTSGQTLRNTLGIASSIVPLCILPVGHVIPTPTPTPTPTPSPPHSPSPTPTLSPSPSPSPSVSPSPTPSPTISLSPSPTPTSTPPIPDLLLVLAVLGLIAVICLSMAILKKKLKIRAESNE
jgi:nitroreductase